MAVNSFIAALGNILEGASSDRERTRKLKELEEEREYTRLERRQLAEDRKNKLAMDKFLFRQELANMGATEGKSSDDLTGQSDSYLPPKKDITTTDLGMGGSLDKQAYRPSFGLSSEPAPKGITLSSKNIGKFTGGGSVLGTSPFEGKDAMDAIDRATKRGNVQTEMDETFELPDGTRMRIPSLLSRQAAGRQVAATEAATARQVLRDESGVETDKQFQKMWALAQLAKGTGPGAAVAKQQFAVQYPDAFDNLFPRPFPVDPLSDVGVKAQIAINNAKEGSRGGFRPSPVQIEKLGAYDAIIGQAEEVQVALENAVLTGTDATGRVAGVLPTPAWTKNLFGMGGDVGEDVRALIGNLYGTLAKEKGGTALSKTELGLLESYVPNQNDSEASGVIKAKRFIREMKRIRDAKLAAMIKYGGADAERFDDGQKPQNQTASSETKEQMWNRLVNNGMSAAAATAAVRKARP